MATSTPYLIVDMAAIAAHAGVTTGTVRQWRVRHPDFPAPTMLAIGPVWHLGEVDRWLERGRPAGRPKAVAVGDRVRRVGDATEGTVAVIYPATRTMRRRALVEYEGGGTVTYATDLLERAPVPGRHL